MTINELRAIISEISNIPVSEINESSSFKDDLGIDSLQMVNLIISISSKFGVELNKIQSNDDLATVGALYNTLTGE